MNTMRTRTIQQCYQVPGQTWPLELGWLYDTISQSMSHAEIGTYCGRSLLASCAAMQPGAVIMSVDDESAWLDKQWVEAVLTATVNLIPHPMNQKRMSSIDACRECKQEGFTFDSIFIDGCHEYAECKADIQAWMSLLKPGGLICGHDYWPVHVGVMDAVNEVFCGNHGVVQGTRLWFFRT